MGRKICRALYSIVASSLVHMVLTIVAGGALAAAIVIKCLMPLSLSAGLATFLSVVITLIAIILAFFIAMFLLHLIQDFLDANFVF